MLGSILVIATGKYLYTRIKNKLSVTSKSNFIRTEFKTEVQPETTEQETTQQEEQPETTEQETTQQEVQPETTEQETTQEEEQPETTEQETTQEEDDNNKK